MTGFWGNLFANGTKHGDLANTLACHGTFCLDDWLEAYPRHIVVFTKCLLNRDKYKCILRYTSDRLGEIEATGIANTTGDAFYAALRMIERSAGKQFKK